MREEKTTGSGRLALTFFRLLLHSFPKDFRSRFGEGMEELFLDEIRRAREGGSTSMASFLARTAWNMPISGIRERRPAGKSAPARTARPGKPPTGVRPSGHNHDKGLSHMLDSIRQDLVFAFRSLRRNPLFTCAALVTLALGIGATTSIFSVVNGVLLTPLPFQEPERLTTIYPVWTGEGEGVAPMSKEDLRDFQDLQAFDAVVGYRGVSEVLTGRGNAAMIPTAQVTSGILAVFGLEPFMGRDLRFDESFPGSAPVAVVSHAFWREELGADPQILGQTLEIQGTSVEVVGVAPPGFDYPDQAEIWRPRIMDPESCGRGCHAYRVVARLAPSVTLGAATEQASALGDRLAESYPDSNQDKRFRIMSLEERIVGAARARLWILFGAVGMVLLIACANVANLFLARAQNRRGEVGVRAALGASRRRLLHQVLTESLLMSLLGGAAGLGLAYGGLALLRRISVGSVPRIEEVSLSGPVLLFALALTLGVAVLFGLVPALDLVRSSPSQALGNSRQKGVGGRGSGRSRTVLLTAEMAFSVVLLIGAGLLLRTMGQLNQVELGYETENILRFNLVLPTGEFDELPEISQFFGELEERVSRIPGVASVGSAFGAPLSRWEMNGGVRVEGRPEPTDEEETDSYLRTVTPGYLETMGIPVLRGRGIESSDDASGLPVAVVNETFARQNFPGEDPMGERFRVYAGFRYAAPVYTIVGVVPDVRSRSVDAPPEPEVYAAHQQVGPEFLTVAVRSRPGSPSPLQAVRREVQAMDSNIPLRDVETLEATVARETSSTRFILVLLGLFAGLALLLASVGLYGVVAYLVSRRRQEFGVRLALGADSGGIVGLVLRQAALPTLAGLGLGLAGALAGARVLESVLFAVDPRDPMVYAGVSGVLLGVALLAALVPARQASRVDPVQALNSE